MSITSARWPPALNKIVQRLQQTIEPKRRYEYLLWFAKRLAPFPEFARIPANKVPGCASQVYILVTMVDGQLVIEGDSDAQITKGLVGLLAEGLNGLSPAEMIQINPDFIQNTGLDISLTPSRVNGFYNIFQTIRKQALIANYSNHLLDNNQLPNQFMTIPDSIDLMRNQLISSTSSPQPLVSEAEMRQAVRTLLIGLGEDPDREGLIDTPARVVKALKFLTSGYQESLDELLNGAIFTENANEMVLVRDIDLFSSCEHHILPIIGRAHVAYIPNGKVIGLSKLARICDMYARRLQVQERLTTQIAEALDGLLKPQGVAVVIEATHMCMVMRGVQKPGSWTVTSSMKGAFADDVRTRQEFMSLIRHNPMFH